MNAAEMESRMDADNEEDATLEELESAFVPLPQLTVEEFVAKAKNHLDQMTADHFNQTGVSTQTEHDWMQDLQNSFDNE